jgi:hypothetical protein
MNRLLLIWLEILRFTIVVDLQAAQKSGNIDAVAWSRIRIADLDRQIDHMRICNDCA